MTNTQSKKKVAIQAGKHFKHGEAPVGTPKELIDPLGPFDGYVKLGNKTIITRRDKPDPNATIGGIASHTWGAEAEIPEAHFNVTLPATPRVDSSAARRELTNEGKLMKQFLDMEWQWNKGHDGKQRPINEPPAVAAKYARRELENAVEIRSSGVNYADSQIQTLLLAEIRRLQEEKRMLESKVRNYLRLAEQEDNANHPVDAASIAARDGAV